MDKEKFGLWLQKEREQRGWSQSDLARFSGLHRQIINKTENGVSMPALETYLALAKAFNISPTFIFRKAGLLPESNTDQVRFEDWEFVLNQLSPDEAEELRQIAIMKIERHQKDKALKNLKLKKV